MPQTRLLSFEFLSLCMVTFLALCNVAVFYNFHLYLQALGLPGKEAGFIIGLYSLTAMALYLTACRRIRLGNAFACMLAGILLVAACGVAYLFCDRFWALALVRMANGTGMFLIMASCMVILVRIIPPEKTGLAFSLYSVAMLSPYSIMPAVSEGVLDWIGSPARLYMATALLLLPAAGFVLALQRRSSGRFCAPDMDDAATAAGAGERGNIFRKPLVVILLVNGAYFTLFSALFYLFEGLAVQRGFENPGFFFTTQMGVMVVIRLLGGRIFDTCSKVHLVAVAMLTTGGSFALLLLTADTRWIFPIAVLFGSGMGLAVPPLNALMYLVSEPRFRGYNANMMMLSIHFGTFLGPFAGSWLIDAGGYDLFLSCAILITACAAGLFLAANPARHLFVTPVEASS